VYCHRIKGEEEISDGRGNERKGWKRGEGEGKGGEGGMYLTMSSIRVALLLKVLPTEASRVEFVPKVAFTVPKTANWKI